jgi:ABC-2 type transport system permease protein
MAVYKKTYSRYDGPLTATWSRFTVLPRYIIEDMYRSRILAILSVVSMVWPLLGAVAIYLNHNLSVLKLANLQTQGKLFEIDDRFFLLYMGFQSLLSFIMTSFVGPGLVSSDLANNALPLYLSRPFSRTEYVLGKLSVLVFLLSAMTWIPGLLLFLLQGYFEGQGWMGNNLHLARALFVGFCVWILVLGFLALAISAWVKWKHVATAMLFLVFFAGAAFAEAVENTLRSQWGNVVNISFLIGQVWGALFGQLKDSRTGAVFFGARRGDQLPLWVCCVALAAICGFCIYLLSVRIRGAEEVKS